MSARGADTKERILDAAQALILERGFSATPIDEIIKSTQLTKGAFFHHFPSKAALGEALMRRYADEDLGLFHSLLSRAQEITDDPLQRILLFATMFEDFVENMAEPFPGCMFASYIYESQQFGPGVHDLIRDALHEWTEVYEGMFEAVIAERKPRTDVSVRQLAEMIVCLMEGAFLLARAYDESAIVVRQSRQFREYLRLLFDTEPAAPSGQSA